MDGNALTMDEEEQEMNEFTTAQQSQNLTERDGALTLRERWAELDLRAFNFDE